MKEIEIKQDLGLTEESKKSEFLAAFDDLYSGDDMPATWTPKDKARVLELTNAVNTKKTIVTSIPMVCRGPKCQFADNCPLQQENIAPIGQSCPFEMGIVRHFMKEFMENLEVDPDNLVEMLLIRDMVDQEVQLLRSTKLLAQEDFIKENVVGIDDMGDPIMQEQLHLAIGYQDKLHKRRQVLFKQFLATRSERLKAGMAALDTAQGLANLMQNYGNLKRSQDEILKQELGIIDVDEYIEADQFDKDEKSE